VHCAWLPNRAGLNSWIGYKKHWPTGLAPLTRCEGRSKNVPAALFLLTSKTAQREGRGSRRSRCPMRPHRHQRGADRYLRVALTMRKEPSTGLRGPAPRSALNPASLSELHSLRIPEMASSYNPRPAENRGDRQKEQGLTILA
jgi:hypothetical protein